MNLPKKEHPTLKTSLHVRNKHRERYDFAQLIASCPALATYVTRNVYHDESIDFFNPQAVKVLNQALLKYYYTIDYWDIPPTYLCPPIPSRADYIHYIADVLGSSNHAEIPRGKTITCLDIGVGANCVYPLIGSKEYGWSFIGIDIDAVAIDNAAKIITLNPPLSEQIQLRIQKNPNHIFIGSMLPNECIDITICNPPFHASFAEAQEGTLRKLSNLQRKKITKPTLNFGGQHHELWCEGGEGQFIQKMIYQSKAVGMACYWFSSLVSKETTLHTIYKALKEVQAIEIKTIPMKQGNKISRIVLWTFLSKKQQEIWVATRWNKRAI